MTRISALAALAIVGLIAGTNAYADDDAGTSAPPPPPTAATSTAQVVDRDNPAAVIAALPPDVRARLTGDQVTDIVRHAGAGPQDAVAKIVPSVFFATLLGIVIALVYARHRRDRLM